MASDPDPKMSTPHPLAATLTLSLLASMVPGQAPSDAKPALGDKDPPSVGSAGSAISATSSKPTDSWPLSVLGRNRTPGGAPAEFPNLRLTGFFQADLGHASQSDRNQAAVGDIQDGTDFRRARLAAVGAVAENVRFMLEMDFAFPGRPSFMDVWAELSDVPTVGNVRFGQFRQPFGLDGLTSVKELTFLERGLPFAFLPFRQTGLMAHGVNSAQDLTWAVSGFRAPVDSFAGNVGDNGGYGVAMRATGVVADSGNGDVLHAGVAFSSIDPTTGSAQFRSQPEFFVSDTASGATPLFVNTGPIAANRVNLLGAELAATRGSWHGQGEFVYAAVDRAASGTASFSGASVQAGWILTGEHRPYHRQNGVLGRVVPLHDYGNAGGGAWEIAGRWSYLDLNDGGIRGGRLHDLTVGVNWYLNSHTKMQFNYVHAFLTSPVSGTSGADVLALRLQLDF